MTPADLWSRLKPVFAQAKEMQDAFMNNLAETTSLIMPFVTVNTVVYFLTQICCVLQNTFLHMYLSCIHVAMLKYCRCSWMK